MARVFSNNQVLRDEKDWKTSIKTVCSKDLGIVVSRFQGLPPLSF